MAAYGWSGRKLKPYVFHLQHQRCVECSDGRGSGVRVLFVGEDEPVEVECGKSPVGCRRGFTCPFCGGSLRVGFGQASCETWVYDEETRKSVDRSCGAFGVVEGAWQRRHRQRLSRIDGWLPSFSLGVCSHRPPVLLPARLVQEVG